MNSNKSKTLSFFLVAASGLGTATARADTDEPPRAAATSSPIGLTLDVEIDPIAYLASGYSLHVGFERSRYRLDLGAFAAELPEPIHGNEGFDVRYGGFGAKLDIFLDRDRSGAFAGIEAGRIDVDVVDRATQMLEATSRFQAGLRAGWRIALPSDFYVTPWIGVGYAVGAGDRMVANRMFRDSPIVVFPTVHFGRLFE